MKLLLDENLPHQLRLLLLPMHDPFTVSYMNWKGISNGKLLSLAAAQGFDALLTTDRGIEYEQNQSALACSVVVLEVKSNKLDDIRLLLPRLLKALESLNPRSFTRVS
jgi:hypothetical protein